MNSRIRTIKLADFPGRTGRGIRIAVIDSGIHPNHPHIGSVEGVIAFDDAGLEHADVIDRLGHGTAVAAAIHEKVPDASLIAVKIFNRNLVTTSAALVAAIQWSIDAGVDLVNLSLGSTNQDRRSMLQELIADAADHRVRIVAAAPTADQNWLPGGLAGAVAVELDWNCPRDECRLVNQLDGGMRAWASGYPRPIPGVPPEQNLKGQSFAVANATGLLALTMGSDPGLTLV